MSFFVTRKSAHVSELPTPLTYVDVLYDHAGYLRNNAPTPGKPNLGPGSLAGRNVCVIGAGPAGLCAAYLLQQQGAGVVVLEASTRVGGRVYSFQPMGSDPVRFELGAMRVPPSEQLFNYFWKEVFGLPGPTVFPDPGKVPTKIIFQNTVSDFNNLPPIFTNVVNSWNAFAGSPALAQLTTNLSSASTFPAAQATWQQLVYPSGSTLGPEQAYGMISFYQGLVQAFVENPPAGCTPWTAQEFALFGALGVGSGGFGPLYGVNFAEIVRLIVNGLETNQQFYPTGLSSLCDNLASSLAASIVFQRRVTAVVSQAGTEQAVLVTSIDAGGSAHNDWFDAVVIATTTRAMEVDMQVTEPPLPQLQVTDTLRVSLERSGARALRVSDEVQVRVTSGAQSMPITNDQATAVQELHLMNSSKLFVVTQTKFWEGTNLPQNIQTDGLVRGLYCLDYGPDTTYGVVLLSYTWGDDSTKYIAVKNPIDRFNLLVRSLAPYPELSDFLSTFSQQAIQSTIQLVDWQDEPQYYGAFKLNYPGQDGMNQSLYYQFLGSTNGVFLAGDSVGWCGGWIEGALQTGMNAAAAIVQRFCGASGLYGGSPMSQNPTQYVYGP